MLQIWRYLDSTDTLRTGVMRGFTDRGGTDVTYRFHRLDDAGRPIRYENGGWALDLVNGARLKLASRIGAMPLAEYEAV